jgi:cytochrome c oxidase assembly protein subunit 11
MARNLTYRNWRLALISFTVAAGMVGASFAAVPLYEVFCQVTGYGGTTQVAEAAPGEVLDRKMTVRFNADVGKEMPWRFVPAQDRVDIKVGEQALAFYRAKNISGRTMTGTATFNVTPAKAGQYFNKVECFCFTEQELKAGAEIDMPVTFFIDPDIANDPNLNEVTTITLSYTFFETEPDPERTVRTVTEPGKTDG